MDGPKARADLAHARRNLGGLERLFMKTRREAAAAGKGAASQSVDLTSPYRFAQQLDGAANRLAIGIVTAAFIVGSAKCGYRSS